MKNTLCLLLLCDAKSKILILFLFLLSMAGKGFSQSEFNYEVCRPSINSEQFNIGASIETALSKGQPSIVIPLFELQGKGYNLPVSLVFYGGDVTCETEASTIGLGWSLMAGGCITTTVRGREDSFITTTSDAPWQFQEEYLSSMFQIPTQRDLFVEAMNTDLMPDEFNYSIPGHQGTFEMVPNSQHQYYQKLFPDESYQLSKTNDGYTIIADDGTKFIFDNDDKETKHSYNNSMPVLSTAWFLTRIETAKGGTFHFTYADEEMIDLHDEVDSDWYGRHQTKRLLSVSSEFGTIVFTSDLSRADRSISAIHGSSITTPSGRIKKIELKDEAGAIVKGYELKNNSYFINTIQDQRTNMGWSNYRMRLDSIVEYDASGNRLPPYVFNYSYSFYRAKSCYNQYSGGNIYPGKRGSWTQSPNFQVLIDLYTSGNPACLMENPNTPEQHLYGFTQISDYSDGTINDYFCLSSIRYPTGLLDSLEYEAHDYSQIADNEQPSINLIIEGKRLKRKTSKYVNGNEQTISITEYKYKKHDSNYVLTAKSSGVLANPTFHSATRYIWGSLPNNDMGHVATQFSSDRPLNTYQGQPIFYKEVEEVVKDNAGAIQKRIIHYMLDDFVDPPMNYIYVRYHNYMGQDCLTPVPNIICGKHGGYNSSISDFNTRDYAYIAYPLGDFTPRTQDGGHPHKEIIIDGNGNQLAKKEYTYSPSVNNVRYGYVFTKEDLTAQNGYTPYMSIYNISRSSYHSTRSHLGRITETAYSYRNGVCDSVVTETNYDYNLGRIGGISTSRQTETIQVSHYYPDYLSVGTGVNLSAEAQAVAALQQKNIIGTPIQTIKSHNGIAVEGSFTDFTVLNSGRVVPKTIYSLALDHSNVSGPSMSNGAIIKNSGFYLQEEAMTYDTNSNPMQVNSRISPTKVYVWGYGGRYPVAVIENYTETELNTNPTLGSLLSQLGTFKKVSNQTICDALKSLNMNIRNNLPNGVLVRTYTYDPYFGLTSEFDYSGVGTIYTYDGFGRLSALYDDRFKLLENYTYHYHQ